MTTSEPWADAAPLLPPLRLLSPADCAAAPSRAYVVKGLIAAGDVAVVYGAPGAGKSVITPHLAYAVAAGQAVFGRRTRACRVLYVATEDTHGMKARVAALAQEDWAREEEPGFALVAESLNLLDPADQHRLLEAVRTHGAGLVVIDTLAAGFAGMDENTSGPDGMGAAVRFLRRVAQSGAAVIAVHHSPKSGDTPRGWGGLAGDADVTLRVVGEPGERKTATLMKNRNGPSGVALAFEVRAVAIGEDEDGETVTAPLCEERAVRAAGTRLAPQLRRALGMLHDTIAGEEGHALPLGTGFPTGLRGCRVAAWRRECEARGLAASEDPATQARVFRGVRRALAERRRIAEHDGIVWVVPEPVSSAPGAGSGAGRMPGG